MTPRAARKSVQSCVVEPPSSNPAKSDLFPLVLRVESAGVGLRSIISMLTLRMTESRPFLRNDKHLQHAILLVRSPQVFSTGTLRQC